MYVVLNSGTTLVKYKFLIDSVKNCPLKTTALWKRICELLYGVHDSQSSNVDVTMTLLNALLLRTTLIMMKPEL